MSLSKSHTLSWCHQQTLKASPLSHSHSSKNLWALCQEAVLVPVARGLSRSKNGLTIAFTISIRSSKINYKNSNYLNAKESLRIISERADRINSLTSSLITNNLSVKISFMVRYWTEIQTNGYTLSAISTQWVWELCVAVWKCLRQLLNFKTWLKSTSRLTAIETHGKRLSLKTTIHLTITHDKLKKI